MKKIHPNGAWGTSPGANDDAMDAYEHHVVQPLEQSLLEMFAVELPDTPNAVWGRVGVLATLKEQAPGLWQHMFDPTVDDEEAQGILFLAFQDIQWLRNQDGWLSQWKDAGAIKRVMSRWEKILLEWMSRRTLGAGSHRR